MTWVDLFLRKYRFRVAAREVTRPGSILDIGCFDDAFLVYLGEKCLTGVGVDPQATVGHSKNGHLLVTRLTETGEFTFDWVVALAVLEHLSHDELNRLLADLNEKRHATTMIVATVPSPHVDEILHLARRLRLIDGMDLDSHDHRSIDQLIASIETGGWTLLRRKRFQLGLNNLLVFASSL